MSLDHLHRDPASGFLVRPREDPKLFLPVPTVVERCDSPATALEFLHDAAARVPDEFANHRPPNPLVGGLGHSGLRQRVVLVGEIARALVGRGWCPTNLDIGSAPDPAQQALGCIKLARQVRQYLDLALDEVTVTIGSARRAPTKTPLRARDSSNVALTAGDGVKGLYVQGSCSFGNATPFSDLDGVVILNHDVEACPQTLGQAAKKISRSTRLLTRRDPLQHHGWLVLAPFLLEAFPQGLLPLDALRESATVFGPTRLTFRPLNSRLIARRRLWRMVQVFRTLSAGGSASPAIDLHQQKLLMSQFMLLPALYAQATGRYVSKRTSFQLVRQELPSAPWDAMDEISAVRKEWSQPTLGAVWSPLQFVLGTWETQALWRRLSPANRRAARLPRIPGSCFARMNDFAEALLVAAEDRARGSAVQ